MATRGKTTAPAPAKKPIGFNAKNYEKPGLTEEEVIEIKEAFDLFDTDGGGSIDPKGIILLQFRAQGSYDFTGFRSQESNHLPDDFRPRRRRQWTNRF
jgi:hypothetical protein